MFDWVPQFVVNFMSSKALTDATGWVKKFSELKWQQLAPAKVIAASQELVKNKRGWFRRKRQQEEEDTEQCEEEAVVLRKSPSPIGLTRYALLTAVFSLSMYNVHLYLSQS